MKLLGNVARLWHNHSPMARDGRPLGEQQLDLQQEQALLLQAQRGERAALEALYRSFAPRLYTQVLMPALGDAQAAQDALADTFRSFIERIHDLSANEQTLFAWLARVARNRAIDMHRARARGGRALMSFESMLGALRDSSDHNPERALEQRASHASLKGHVHAVLEQLNPRYRRALQLRFLEDRSRAQCAELMEVKLATFDVLLLRALRSFHKAFIAQAGGVA